MSPLSLSTLLSLPHPEIVDALKRIYEHSLWVAEGLVRPDEAGRHPIDGVSTIGDVSIAMKKIVNSATHEQKLELLRAHPDLCEKIEAMSKLTESSQVEQSKAGLQSLTEDERANFKELNSQYKSKFGFPFILAVRNATKYTVLSALEGRVNNTVDVEFAAALTQVHKIAWMRLLAAIQVENRKGFLTCHVLDTANGCPGKFPFVFNWTKNSAYNIFWCLTKISFVRMHSCKYENSTPSHQSARALRIHRRVPN